MADKNDLLDTQFGKFLLSKLPDLSPKRTIGPERESQVQLAADAILSWIKMKPGTYKKVEFLGRGGYAETFWIKSDGKKVLKLTTDVDDAKACQILAEKPDKDLLSVYGTVEVIDGFWGVLVEKLTPLSGSQRKMWEKAQEAFWRLHSDIKGMGMGKFWMSDLLEDIERAEKTDNATELKAAKDARAVLPLMTKWVEKLTGRGITWRDFKPDNIMMRGRIPIISDLGVSWIKGSPSIPKLLVDYK